MIKAFILKVRYRENCGWCASMELTNNEFCKKTAIEGSLGVKYYCDTLKEAIEHTLDAIKELNIPLHEELAMFYSDESNIENPDECPKELFEEYMIEKQRLYSQRILKDTSTFLM